MLREFNFLNSISIFLSSKCLDLNLFFVFCYFKINFTNIFTNSTIHYIQLISILLKVIVKGNLALQLNLCIKHVTQNLMELGL